MTTESDRERITKKMLAHVNKNNPYKMKRNPLRDVAITFGAFVLLIVILVVTIENAQEIDEFFTPNVQRMMLVWWLPFGLALGVLGWIWYRIKRM